MGEYIELQDPVTGVWQVAKLGTCEDLFYVRYTDLRAAVDAGRTRFYVGNLEPAAYLRTEDGFRFRFPFPDEDGAAWTYENYDRGVLLYAPAGFVADVEHRRMFHSCAPRGGGYNVNVAHPCPQAPEFATYPHQTSTRDWDYTLVELCQQRPIAGALWAVLRCAYCGARFRLDHRDARVLADFHWKLAPTDEFTSECLDRMLAGYEVTL